MLPEPLSYVDGALVSCGFGTAYEGLLRLELSGQDRLLITGLGPVGLAAAMLGRALGAGPIIADRRGPGRCLPPTIQEITDGRGCEASIDCSGSAAARNAWRSPGPGHGRVRR